MLSHFLKNNYKFAIEFTKNFIFVKTILAFYFDFKSIQILRVSSSETR